MRRSFQQILYLLFFPLSLFSQQHPPTEPETPSDAAAQVEIKPLAQDIEIQKRLEDILNATGWFSDVQIQVREGVVFLNGIARSEEYKKWAGNLGRNTQNVVAVVNKMQIAQPPVLDFSIIQSKLLMQWRSILRAVPSIIIGTIILIIAWVLARIATLIVSWLLKKRFGNSLLQNVIGKMLGFMIFLLGVYLIFEMADLTGAALTIISGTGLLGIILGIAFRDITENFLASILLSIHHPFKNNDLVEIGGMLGYVQGLTMRMTLLMSLDGDHIQIPNATVYKSNIRNYSSNQNRREHFVIGIGYDNAIATAQEIAMNVLKNHELILDDPEPWAIVDGLGSSSIQLGIYFWLDGREHSWLKVKSSVIRLIKKAFQEAGISLPDEARERILLNTLSVKMEEKHLSQPQKEVEKEPDKTKTDKKSGVKSEAKEIKEQAKLARNPEEGKNLLNSKPPQEDSDSFK